MSTVRFKGLSFFPGARGVCSKWR